MKLNWIAPSFGVALCALACGCDRGATAPNTAAPVTQSAAPAAEVATPAAKSLPDSIWLAAAPENAKGVAELKKSAKEGEEVVVHGRIGGRKEPFVPGRAIFLLTDSTIKICSELHGDGCPTPWDYCCEPKESLMASIATIEIVDADGKPFKTDVEGVHGLKPTAEISVVGKVDSAGDSLVVHATKVYAKP